jgi:hypothetical protein
VGGQEELKSNCSYKIMKYCHYYWAIEPFRGDIKDDPSRVPVFKIPMDWYGTLYELTVFCDEQGSPEIARLRIPNLPEEKIPEKVSPIIQTVKEHLLTALRATFRRDISLWDHCAWAFFDEDKPYSINLRADYFGRDIFEPDKSSGFFVATFPMREVVRLYVDGTNPGLPLQYRFLSMYKILENHFKSKGRWNKKALDVFLEKFSSEFYAQGFQGNLAGVLHNLRDKCAHIKVGTRRESLGVTHLNHVEAVRAEKALKVLNNVCASVLNERAEGAFTVMPAPEPSWNKERE